LFEGLDLLETAVLALDARLRVVYVNTALENLVDLSGKSPVGQTLHELFVGAEELERKLVRAIEDERGFADEAMTLTRPGHEPVLLTCVVTPVEQGACRVLMEMRPMEKQLRVQREEQQLTQLVANRELIRNLAHEIKNPLGGLRGSAQLLERELDRPELREYTQVIIKEADRLQALMDRLLTPHRPPQWVSMNIHEVCERVRSLILAEFPAGLRIRRDYDTSIPEFRGDREQLIQAVLNIARNAAQAMAGVGEIRLRTRIVRQVTLAKKRHQLALELQVMDNGPGIPADIRDRIFFPLVSGREGGSGLGLTLAQTFVQHHHGVIECDSEPGNTKFTVLLPLARQPGRSATSGAAQSKKVAMGNGGE
jgi:two-component system nitrogen regulation sensor histidine kinase GlnL